MTPINARALGWIAALAVAACAKPHKVATKPKLDTTRSVALVQPTDPKLIEMTAEPTTTLIGASATSQLAIRIQIRAGELPARERPPLNLALVLDTSGSMEGDAIASVRKSARLVIDKLRDGDQLSVLTFGSKPNLLVPMTRITAANRAAIGAAVSDLQATGTTELAGGLAAGLQQVLANRPPNGINRLVLLSDGVPNSSTTIPGLIAQARQMAIPVTSLGLGIDYDTVLMTQIARDTGGSFHYLENPEVVASVFDGELTRMSSAVGKNLNLVLQPGPNVTIEPMPGLVATGDGRVYAVLGDLAAGEKRDLMIPIKVAARGDGSTSELLQTTLTFDDVIGRTGNRTREAFVAVKASRDAAAVRAAVKIDLEVARVRTVAASAILEAIALARQGQIEVARKKLAATSEIVKNAVTRLGDPELAKIVVQLDEVAKQLGQLVAQVVPVPIVPPGSPTPKRAAPAPATAPAPIETVLRRTEQDAVDRVSGRAR